MHTETCDNSVNAEICKFEQKCDGHETITEFEYKVFTSPPPLKSYDFLYVGLHHVTCSTGLGVLS